MKIHLYILRQLVVAFVFAVGALLFIALPGIAVSTVHKMPSVDATILLKFLPLVLQSLAPYVLPLCFMLSVVAVFGRLAADKEWIAIHMAGIHPLKTLFAPFLVATGLGVLTFWMASNELPQLKRRQKDVIVNAAGSVIENLQPGKTSIKFGKFHLLATSRNEDGTFSGVYLRIPPAEGGETKDVFASWVSVTLSGGGRSLDVLAKDVQLFDPTTGDYAQSTELAKRVDLESQLGKNQHNFDRAKYLVSSEIRKRMEAPDVPPEKLREYRFMLHSRATMFAIYFLFLGLGAATGLMMRRGTQLGALAVAAGYGIVYYVLNMRIGKELGLSSSLPPWAGPWLTTIIGGVIAVGLLKRAMRR